VCIRSGVWEISWLHDHLLRDPGQTRPNQCNSIAQPAQKPEGSTKAHENDNSPKSVCIQVTRQMLPVLLTAKEVEGISIDQGVR